jgi:hypothetical protein
MTMRGWTAGALVAAALVMVAREATRLERQESALDRE